MCMGLLCQGLTSLESLVDQCRSIKFLVFDFEFLINTNGQHRLSLNLGRVDWKGLENGCTRYGRRVKKKKVMHILVNGSL